MPLPFTFMILIQLVQNRSDEKKSSSESPEASQSIKAPPDGEYSIHHNFHSQI